MYDVKFMKRIKITNGWGYATSPLGMITFTGLRVIVLTRIKYQVGQVFVHLSHLHWTNTLRILGF